MPEDEASGTAYQKLQAQNEWRLSHMQAAHCLVLLSCQALPRAEMSSAILSEHQTQAQAAATAAEVSL